MNLTRGLTLCLTILATFTGPLQAQPPANDAPFWKAFDAKGDLSAAFAALPKPAERFSVLAAELAVRKNGPALEKLVAAMAKIDPNHRLLSRVRLHAALLEGGDATAAYRAAYKAAPDAAARQSIREDYLRCMARQGRAVEAYRAFPGGSESFRVLADQLFASGLADQLAALVEEHRENFPDDPTFDIYGGQTAFERKDYAQAHQLWTSVFEQKEANGSAVVDEALASRYRSRRARAAVAAGKWQEVYPQLGDQALDIIGKLCLELNRPGDLEQMLEKHGNENTYYASKLAIQLALHKDPKADLKTLIGLDKGTLAEKRNRLQRAIEVLANQGRALEVYRAAPDADTFWQLCNQLWHHDNLRDLRRLIELHKENHPTDRRIAEYEAYLLFDRGEHAKALEILQKLPRQPGRSLVLPSDMANVYFTARLAAGSTVATVIEEEGTLAYYTLADYFINKRDADGLKLVIDARPGGRIAREWDYAVDLKIIEGKIDDAIALFQTVPEKKAAEVPKVRPNPFKIKQPAEKEKPFGKAESFDARKHAELQLMRKLAAVGEGMRAYRISQNPDYMFSHFASQLLRDRDLAGLAALVAEHRKNFPSDPHLSVVEGELAFREGRLFDAEDAFRRAKRTDPLSPFGRTAQHPLMAIDIRRGRVLECYRANGGDPEAFQKVANLCVTDKASAALDTLLDAHRTAHPRDPHLNALAAKADMLRGDWEAALKRMDVAEARSESEREDIIVCLIRLKRTDEAVRIAHNWETNARLGYAFLPAVLAHAAAGDVKETERLVGLYAYRGPYLSWFYSHEVLGPLLRGEAMASVRERFPEPKK